ncbi:hypothetical protein [Streptomyces sp. NBC_01803]|uniref:hypothetical protein n=1 Tax=Streptomyces sp. NBC_01803 TaxID=2975946 RepID=UPI002DD87BFA|nr:hypothetical protein [Streptomyces sp. NBC_01803]WSA45191.1 hypothetical protein OIE51_13825 [Streptomyces sp. NBC_01803]
MGTRSRARSRADGLLRGAAAGAAGTAALHIVTCLDMAARGRAASRTPEETVEKLSAATHVPVPGAGETRAHRVAALGALSGLVVGVGVGAALGAVRATGPVRTALAAGLGAMAGGNGPMAALGVTDLRTWSRADWLSDAVPHAAYGAVTAGVLHGLRRGQSA